MSGREETPRWSFQATGCPRADYEVVGNDKSAREPITVNDRCCRRSRHRRIVMNATIETTI